MGLKAHSPLHLMLSKKRAIPKKYIPYFIQSLGLNQIEGLYLENMLEFSKAKTLKGKEHYSSRLKALSPKAKLNMVEVNSYKYLKDPIHCAILEMIDLVDFKKDPKWIQNRLIMKTTPKEIELAIERLIQLGLINLDSEGCLVKTHQFISCAPDVRDEGVQEYHANVAQLGIQSLSEQALQEREFNAYSLNIQASSLPKAKAMIRKFCSEFMHEFESKPNEGEATYQINVQFFSLTQNNLCKKNEGDRNEKN